MVGPQRLTVASAPVGSTVATPLLIVLYCNETIIDTAYSVIKLYADHHFSFFTRFLASLHF